MRRGREHIDIDTMKRCAVVIHTELVCAQKSGESLKTVVDCVSTNLTLNKR